MKRQLDKLGDHFIGLWRFRIKGQPRLWCVTLHIDGYYYDTWGKRTPKAALQAAYQTLTKHRKP